MGCDIHMMVEVKKEINNDEKWVSYDHFRKNPYYGVLEDEDELQRVDLYDARNYVAFSQLCGVRSYFDDSPRISEPRWIPSDSCDYIKGEVKKWDGDAHSHSFATLADIVRFRATLAPTKFKGMISQQQAMELDEHGKKPDSWFAWTSNDSYVHREWDDLVDALKPIQEALEQRAIENWWHKDNIEPENIRIVFFFDN